MENYKEKGDKLFWPEYPAGAGWMLCPATRVISCMMLCAVTTCPLGRDRGHVSAMDMRFYEHYPGDV